MGLTDSSGEIAFQVVPKAGASREAPCPVCGEALGPAPTRCPGCDTPHHFDCWEYNEGCGVYGCKAKPRPSPARAEENTVDLPAKLGLPHKRVGSYAGVWWVPPVEGLLAIALEIVAISALAGGSYSGGLAALGGMAATLFWIAVSSVRYYVDFETRCLTKAKSALGRDVLEWTVVSLDQLECLELRTSADALTEVAGLAPICEVLARYRGGRSIEIAPPLRLDEAGMLDLADLFRRIRASGAFRVEMPEEVMRLPPPAQNQLLLAASKKSP